MNEWAASSLPPNAHDAEAITMQIGAISSISPIQSAFNPVLAVNPASTATSALANTPASETPNASQPGTPPPPPPAPPVTAAAPAPRPHGSGGAGAAVAEAAAASTASTVEQLIGVYSTTVGGQQYAGTVEESDGVYTVSVPNLPGATASGTSEMSAENNLDTVIDELV
jgi:hypothetical protein